MVSGRFSRAGACPNVIHLSKIQPRTQPITPRLGRTPRCAPTLNLPDFTVGPPYMAAAHAAIPATLRSDFLWLAHLVGAHLCVRPPTGVKLMTLGQAPPLRTGPGTGCLESNAAIPAASRAAEGGGPHIHAPGVPILLWGPPPWAARNAADSRTARGRLIAAPTNGIEASPCAGRGRYHLPAVPCRRSGLMEASDQTEKTQARYVGRAWFRAVGG